jgi:hypothetical protein
MKKLPLIVLILLASQAWAQTPEAEPSPSPTPDFSEEKMRFVFRDYLVPPPPAQDRAPAITVYERWGWVFKYVPIFLGYPNDGATFGHAAPMSMPDPFYALNTSFPETKDTFRPLPTTRELTLDERRYRRAMIRVTTRANDTEQKP